MTQTKKRPNGIVGIALVLLIAFLAIVGVAALATQGTPVTTAQREIPSGFIVGDDLVRHTNDQPRSTAH